MPWPPRIPGDLVEALIKGVAVGVRRSAQNRECLTHNYVRLLDGDGDRIELMAGRLTMMEQPKKH